MAGEIPDLAAKRQIALGHALGDKGRGEQKLQGLEAWLQHVQLLPGEWFKASPLGSECLQGQCRHNPELTSMTNSQPALLAITLSCF